MCVPGHICVCVCHSLSLIGTLQCKHPFLPIPHSIAVMPRDDKPFCCASWRRGVLLPEIWRWQGPSPLSVHPRGETLWLGLNSGLTSLSAPEVPRQTCRDSDWHELTHIKSRYIIAEQSTGSSVCICLQILWDLKHVWLWFSVLHVG